MTTATNPAPDDPNRPTSNSARVSPPAKRGGHKKISRALVALSAATILAVYSVGYVGSQSAAANVAAPASTVAASQQGSSAVTSNLNVVATATTAGSVATAAVGYKEGTYVGQGTSRHGGIQAQVVIQGGNIVSAAITGSSTRYPTSAIASLPPAVVSQQSPNVDLVSGATDSSSAYIQAVTSALAQAA